MMFFGVTFIAQYLLMFNSDVHSRYFESFLSVLSYLGVVKGECLTSLLDNGDLLAAGENGLTEVEVHVRDSRWPLQVVSLIDSIDKKTLGSFSSFIGTGRIEISRKNVTVKTFWNSPLFPHSVGVTVTFRRSFRDDSIYEDHYINRSLILTEGRLYSVLFCRRFNRILQIPVAAVAYLNKNRILFYVGNVRDVCCHQCLLVKNADRYKSCQIRNAPYWYDIAHMIDEQYRSVIRSLFKSLSKMFTSKRWPPISIKNGRFYLEYPLQLLCRREISLRQLISCLKVIFRNLSIRLGNWSHHVDRETRANILTFFWNYEGLGERKVEFSKHGSFIVPSVSVPTVDLVKTEIVFSPPSH